MVFGTRLLGFQTLLLSQTSQSMLYVLGYSFRFIHYFCVGLSAKWMRKNLGTYSTKLKVIIQLDKSLG